jgi:tetratricopeptide (TPR) repeat protein
LAIAEGRLGAGDTSGAREAFLALLDLERENTRARFGLAQCDVREGELDAAEKRYQALARDPKLSVLERASALEAVGDVAVMAARPERAVEAYSSVAKLDADEDRQRTLEVKMLAALAPAGAGLRTLLIGTPKAGASWDEAAPLLGAEAAAGDPLSQYLVGRNLWLHGRAQAALRYLDDAMDPEPRSARAATFSWPPSQSIVREALRLRIIITCADRRLDRRKAGDDARRLREDPGMPAAKREAVSRFAKRCGL